MFAVSATTDILSVLEQAPKPALAVEVCGGRRLGRSVTLDCKEAEPAALVSLSCLPAISWRGYRWTGARNALG